MRVAVAIVSLMLTIAVVAAQPDGAGVRSESTGARRKLAEAEQLLAAGKAAAARDLVLKLLDDGADELILLDEGRYVSARWFAQRVLARLPADYLDNYRDRIEAASRKLLDDGRLRNNPQPLMALLDQYYLSRPAAEALDLLGEMAFERGDFALAEHYWSQLTDEAPAESRYPAKPSPVHLARIALAIHRQGDAARSRELSQKLQRDHPNAVGRIAGQDGRLTDRLRAELALPPANVPGAASREWPMLGGDAGRSGHVEGQLKSLSPSPLWTVAIPGAAESGPIIGSARTVAFHPVLTDRTCMLATNTALHAFDLTTGTDDILYEVPSNRTWRNADFTISTRKTRVYARLGDAAIISNANQDGESSAKLVAWNLNDESQSETGVLWSVHPPVTAGVAAGWEGTPLAVGDTVLAAYSRVEGGKLVQAIACLADATGKPLWTTDVCEVGIASAESRERHELLTLAGANVIFVSQTGVVAAVNARTGKPAWSQRYPRMASPREPRLRDISPAVAAGGRVFVAPNDSDRLLCYDAGCGRLLWQSEPIVVDHIIGVHGSRVIAAIAGPHRGVRAFDVRTGSCELPNGWKQHDDPVLPTFGRGLIAGDLIAWPTAAGLVLLNVHDGMPARPLLRGVHGNLAFADGRLAVASPKSLSLFAVPSAPIALVERQVLPSMEWPTQSPLLSLADTDSPLPIVNTSPAIAVVRPNGDMPSPGFCKLDDFHVGNAAKGWVLDSSRRRQFSPCSLPTAPRFDDSFFVRSEMALVHLSNGRCWHFNTETGAILGEFDCSSGRWTTPPVALDDHRIAFPSGPGEVGIYDVQQKKTLWNYQTSFEASLAGLAPQLRRQDRFVDVLIARNHGVEAIRLDEKATPCWLQPATFNESSVSLTGAAGDDRHLYLPLPGRIVALSGESGRIRWEKRIPTGRWSLHRLGNGVAVVPHATLCASGWSWLPPSPSCILRLSLATLASEPQSIRVLDADSGEQRFAIDWTAGPITDVAVRADGLWLATPRTIYRVK